MPALETGQCNSSIRISDRYIAGEEWQCQLRKFHIHYNAGFAGSNAVRVH